MNNYEQEWINEYVDFGFPEDWIQDVIEKHGIDILNQLNKKSNPLNFYKIKPLKFEQNSEILNNIYVPESYTVSEVLLFILDCLDCLGKNLPNEDAKIYELYETITINQNISFEEFYVFVRKIKHINIKKIPQYKLISKTVEDYTLDSIPFKNSIWEIPYEEGIIKIKVKEENKKSELNLYDEKICSQVLDIIEPINESYITKGDKIKIKPCAFNNGKYKKMSIEN